MAIRPTRALALVCVLGGCSVADDTRLEDTDRPGDRPDDTPDDAPDDEPTDPADLDPFASPDALHGPDLDRPAGGDDPGTEPGDGDGDGDEVPMSDGDLAATATELRATFATTWAHHAFLFAWAGDVGGDPGKVALGQAGQASHAIADLVGGVYGRDVGLAFFEAWRARDAHLAQYVTALDSGDTHTAAQAEAALAADDDRLVEVLAQADGGIDRAALAAALDAETAALLDVLDAQAAADADRWLNLRFALHRAAGAGEHLALAIDAGHGERFAGDAAGAEAELAAHYTVLWAEHAWLATFTTGVHVAGGDWQAAKTVLDANSIEIGDVIGWTYGPNRRYDWIRTWRDLLNAQQDYVAARLAGDQAAMDAAEARMRACADEEVALLGSLDDDVDTAAFSTAVHAHIDRLLGVAELQAAGDAAAFARAHETALSAAEIGAMLAIALAAEG